MNTTPLNPMNKTPNQNTDETLLLKAVEKCGNVCPASIKALTLLANAFNHHPTLPNRTNLLNTMWQFSLNSFIDVNRRDVWNNSARCHLITERWWNGEHEYDYMVQLNFAIRDETGPLEIKQTRENFAIIKARLINAAKNNDDFINMIVGDEPCIYYGQLYFPSWAFVLLQPYVDSLVFETEDDFIAAIESAQFLTKSSHRFDKFLADSPPELVGKHLTLNNLRRKIHGKNHHINSLENAILKALSNNNNLRAEQFRTMQRDEINAISTLDQEYSKVLAEIKNLELKLECKTVDLVPSMMENETQQEAENVLDVSENTALGTTAIENPTILMVKSPNVQYVDEILTDVKHKYPDLTSRWILGETISITTKITAGDIIAQIHLPAKYVISQWDTPNMLPFKTHEFFTGSMKLKLVWNIPKTNQFAIRFGYVYHLLQRDRPEEVVNLWSISQQPGGRLNGHMANSDELDIPFFSYTPTIPIMPNSTQMNLYYVTLNVIAMTSYEVASGATDRANLNVYFKFGEDLTFYGQRQTLHEIPAFDPYPTIDVQPAMLTAKSIAANAGMSLLSGLTSTANAVVSTSLKTANRVLNRTIEDGISQALGALGSNRDKPLNVQNEMFHQRAATNIASGNGNFSGESMRLQQLGNTTHPEFLVGVEKYTSIQSIIETQGFINSFRVDSSMPHGALLASFLIQPSALGQMTYGARFPEGGSFNYTPLDHLGGWFANYQGKTHYHFEAVADGFKTCRLRFAYVPNRLTLKFEESHSVYYETMDIGPDLNTQQSFDFFTPFIHNAIHFNHIASTSEHIIAGSLHVFLETVVNMAEGMYDSFDVLVFKSAKKDEFVLSVPRPNATLLIYNDDSVPLPPIPEPPPPPEPLPNWISREFRFRTLTFSLSPGAWTATLEFAIDGIAVTRIVGSSLPSVIFSVTGPTEFRSGVQTSIIEGTPMLITCQSTWNPSTIQISMFGGRRQYLMGAAQISSHDPLFVDVQTLGPTPVPTFTELETLDLHPSMDIREVVSESTDITKPISLMNEGLHGESHMHLYENLRRFEHVSSNLVNVPLRGLPTRILRVPINFGGPVFRQYMNNVQKQSKITHLHDAMRFTRGSMRHCIIVTGSLQGVLRIVHKPQVRYYAFTPGSQAVESDYDSTGYAETIISLSQNNVGMVEYPMYQPNAAMLNASYTSSELFTQLAQGLGHAEFFWQGPAANLTITILRAVGDDTMMYGFNGFPVRIARLEDKVPFYETLDVRPSMLSGMMMKKQTEDQVVKTLESIEKASDTISDFKRLATQAGGLGLYAGTLITQVGHIINNPTKTTFAISATQILISFGIFDFGGMEMVQKAFEKAWHVLGDPISPRQVNVVNVTPAGIGDDFADLSSCLASMICGYFGVKDRKLTKTEKLSIGFKDGATMQVRIVDFFKNLLDYLKNLIVSICEEFFPESKFLKWLKTDVYADWNTQVNIITDATIFDRLKNSPHAISIVYQLVTTGDALAGRLMKTKRANGNLARITLNNLAALKKLRDKLGKNADTPLVKFDPFCYYIASNQCQIGKSECMKDISQSIAKENFGLDDNVAKPIFLVPAGEKYWENYDNQLIMHFDDFERTKMNEVCDSDCSRLAGLKGPADFNIPRAFEAKGQQSVARLIGCASNKPYPDVSGILSDVVWSRRNCLMIVTANFSIYKHCDDHSVFRFACGTCVNLNERTELAERKHLAFQQMDPMKLDQKIKGTMTYAEAKTELLRQAKEYYTKENVRYNECIEELKTRKIPGPFLIPNEPIESFLRMLEHPEYKQVMEQLGGNERKRPMVDLEPSGWKDLFNRGILRPAEAKLMEDDEEEDVFSLTPCKHSLIDDDSRFYFHKNYYEVEVIIDEECHTLTNAKCSEHCIWLLREESYLIERYGGIGAFPKNFPQRFRKDILDLIEDASREEVVAVEEQPWYKKNAKILYIVGGLVTGIGVILAVKHLWTKDTEEPPIPSSGMENFEPVQVTELFKTVRQEEIQQRLAENKIVETHPALQTSGDVKTKFLSKVKTIKQRIVARVMNVRPSVTVSEKEAMLQQYILSIVEISTKEKDIVARCVAVSPSTYFTQLHSMLSIVTRITNQIKNAYRGGSCCDDKCHKQDNFAVHSTKCAQKAADLFPLTLTKVDQSGKTSSKNISLDELLTMNGGTLGIDWDGSDVCVFNLLIKDFQTKSIERYLVSNSTLPYVNVKSLRVNEPGRVGKADAADYEAKNAKEVTMNSRYSGAHIAQWSDKQSETFFLSGYSCENPDVPKFKNGCGSIIYDEVTLCILGFMSASSDQRIYFNAYSQESNLDYHSTRYTMKGLEGETITLRQKKSNLVEIPIEDKSLLQTVPAMRIWHSTKTNIQESVCHEKFGPVVRRPCNISQNGDKGQAALINGLANYKPHATFPRKHMAETIEDLKQHFRSHCKPQLPIQSKRNLEEAICGIAGHIPRITMSTSPGFPWCCHRETKRKTDLITFDDEHMLEQIHADLLALVNTNEELMRNNETPMTIYQISHKDERLAEEKIDNVRLIQGSPLDLTISARKYLMDFNYAFQECRDVLEHKVGINIMSIEWNEMTRELIDFSPYICVGDFSKFGPRLLTEFVENAYDLMIDWYEFNGAGEDSTVRKVLGKRATNSLNLAYNQVIKLDCGSPSGAINTVIVNSLCNMQYIRCAWIGIMEKQRPKISSLASFRDFVKFVCYGDDVIFSVKPEVIEIFNNQTISEYFREFDVKYTDVTKGDEMRRFCDIEEATFLKCGFRFFTETSIDPGVWVCLPNLADLKDTTNWVRTPKGKKQGANIENILLDGAIANCEDAIRRSWFHGLEEFTKLQNEIRLFWSTYPSEYQPKYYSYEGLQREYGYPLKDSYDATSVLALYKNARKGNHSVLSDDDEDCYCEGLTSAITVVHE